jgi:hypothetical protein
MKVKGRTHDRCPSSSDFLADDELAVKLDRLARYHARFEWYFYRALRDLKALQTDAALTRTLPAYFMQTSPPLASRTQIAKRTQILAHNDRILGADEYFTGAEAEAAALYRVLKDHKQLAIRRGLTVASRSLDKDILGVSS